jgi:hypothetical protein
VALVPPPRDVLELSLSVVWANNGYGDILLLKRSLILLKRSQWIQQDRCILSRLQVYCSPEHQSVDATLSCILFHLHIRLIYGAILYRVSLLAFLLVNILPLL